MNVLVKRLSKNLHHFLFRELKYRNVLCQSHHLTEFNIKCQTELEKQQKDLDLMNS